MTVNEFLRSMRKRGKPAKETSLASFERELEIKLPKEYRNFLKKCDGGRCGERLRFAGRPPDVYVDRIFGSKRSETGISLPRILDWIRMGEGPPFPKGLLPIMGDPGGNAICLGLRGKDAGKIFFWDHEGGSRRRLLANSFNEFVQGLEPEPDDEDG